MKTLICAALLSFASFVEHDRPIEITWEDLKIEESLDVYIEELDAYYWESQFNETQIRMNEDHVKIEGYLGWFGYDDDDPFFVLQKFQNSHYGCCYMPGPDELIDLLDLDLTVEDYKSMKNKRVEVIGKMNVNIEHDVYRLDYQLENPQFKVIKD